MFKKKELLILAPILFILISGFLSGNQAFAFAEDDQNLMIVTSLYEEDPAAGALYNNSVLRKVYEEFVCGLGFEGEFAFAVGDNRRYNGGNERKFGDFSLSLWYSNIKKISDNSLLEVLLEYTFNVIDFRDRNSWQNSGFRRADGFKSQPELLGFLGFNYLAGQNNYTIRLGAQEVAGLPYFESRPTSHIAFNLSPVELSKHYDLSLLLKYSRASKKGRLQYFITLAMTNSEWAIGQESVFHSEDSGSNSSPGFAGRIGINPLAFLNSNYGSLKFYLSVMESKRRSNPGRKEFWDQLIYSIDYSTKWFWDNKRITVRLFGGELDRGLTSGHAKEVTEIRGVELSLVGIKLGGRGSLSLYSGYSEMELKSGESQEIWQGATNEEEQLVLGVRWVDFFGIKDLSLNAAGSFWDWNTDGYPALSIPPNKDTGFYLGMGYNY